ncbi:uncharacterized protein LOC119181551 isoform X12 [Rhipicephalus microplus]|uniref:uncharacterized protein LOC119181551 isoform X12 n=1 Tax=Rhipicephalus microplus TaxID=6941 RepID=UPI003F6B2B6B
MSVDEDVLSSHDEDNMWYTNVYDLGEAQASATCDDCEVLASVPQLPASTLGILLLLPRKQRGIERKWIMILKKA